MPAVLLALIPARFQDRAKAIYAALAAVLAAVVPLIVAGENRPVVYVVAVLAAFGLGGVLTYAVPNVAPGYDPKHD